MSRPSTQKQIGEILAILSASFPRFQMTPETIRVYTMMLQDIPADELNAAAMKCAAEKDFFPSVHELRAAVSEIRRRIDKTPSAFEAWQEVVAKPRSSTTVTVDDDNHIVRRPVTWSHPIVERVALQLGWYKSFPGDNPAADRAHFFRAYEYELDQMAAEAIEPQKLRDYIDSRAQKLLVSPDRSENDAESMD